MQVDYPARDNSRWFNWSLLQELTSGITFCGLWSAIKSEWFQLAVFHVARYSEWLCTLREKVTMKTNMLEANSSRWVEGCRRSGQVITNLEQVKASPICLSSVCVHAVMPATATDGFVSVHCPASKMSTEPAFTLLYLCIFVMYLVSTND